MQNIVAQTPDLLCPLHGPPIRQGIENLEKLHRNLAEALAYPPCEEPTALNFPDKNSPARGFRELTPHIHQWKTGNTIVLTSDDGRAIVIDDGLCIWEKLPARLEKHDMIFAQMKAALAIQTIDWIIPTHYHGDHTELIPHLAQKEQGLPSAWLFFETYLSGVLPTGRFSSQAKLRMGCRSASI